MSGPAGAGGGGGDMSNYGDDSDMGKFAAMDTSRVITHLMTIIDEAGIVDYDPSSAPVMWRDGNCTEIDLANTVNGVSAPSQIGQHLSRILDKKNQRVALHCLEVK
ncbi:hypothetical protein KIN20_004341 [Parelaphostrongylus tenuis]|uniref:Uncharacterized protein n=1 Tax=Parelaphostrongylus tenuis TaxID=148309 RepID=A0AAD5LYB4_PARTN|nr:hypothetical protein KIN20_004341 [Parelaphostrongylus tenuis]